jgi:general secretion pathway protein G
MLRRRIIRRAGFTLVELILVITILGILAGVVTVNIVGSGEKARKNAAKTEIRTIEAAIEMFEIHMGRLPTEDEGLEALVVNPDDNPEWSGPYLKRKQAPRDPWKQDYIYDPEGDRGMNYDLYSPGSDGQADTDDDIGNWEEEDEG